MAKKVATINDSIDEPLETTEIDNADIDEGVLVDDGIIIEDGVTDDAFLVEPEPYTAEELAAMQAEMERQGEIATAKQILNQTDYNMLKAIEDILTSTTATELIAKLKDLSDSFGDVIKLRRKQRDIINELEQ